MVGPNSVAWQETPSVSLFLGRAPGRCYGRCWWVRGVSLPALLNKDDSCACGHAGRLYLWNTFQKLKKQTKLIRRKTDLLEPNWRNRPGGRSKSSKLSRIWMPQSPEVEIACVWACQLGHLVVLEQRGGGQETLFWGAAAPSESTGKEGRHLPPAQVGRRPPTLLTPEFCPLNLVIELRMFRCLQKTHSFGLACPSPFSPSGPV